MADLAADAQVQAAMEHEPSRKKMVSYVSQSARNRETGAYLRRRARANLMVCKHRPRAVVTLLSGRFPRTGKERQGFPDSDTPVGSLNAICFPVAPRKPLIDLGVSLCCGNSPFPSVGWHECCSHDKFLI